MPSTQDDMPAQGALWNGAAGRAWVDAQAMLDALFEPLERRLVDAVRARTPRRVLDVGCGTGATTLAIARVLPADARCTGVDVSQPMIAAARMRAADEHSTADFVCADAQRHAFGADRHDMLVSRFGVMFFDDPVAAFANLRRAATPTAALCSFAWRDPRENPFMTAAERAARPLLPQIPVAEAGAPGQFAFADRDRVARILDAAGWSAIEIDAVDIPLRLPAASLERYFTRLGPLGRVLADVDAAVRARVVDTVRTAFEPYVHGEDVRFDAACWRIGARASADASPGARS